MVLYWWEQGKKQDIILISYSVHSLTINTFFGPRSFLTKQVHWEGPQNQLFRDQFLQ